MDAKPHAEKLIARTACRSGFQKELFNVAATFFLSLILVSPGFATLTLDPTFNGGRVTISFPDSSSGYSSRGIRIFVQSSGRIVAAGDFTWATADGQLAGSATVGLSQTGALDTTYGSGGSALDWRSDAFTSFRDALMYADGSILRLSQVVRLPAASNTVRTVRLTANGSEDGVFASNVSIGPCCFGFFNARAIQVALRGDGKILVLMTDEGGYFLYRLNQDGTRDTTFGTNGVIGLVFNKFSPTNLIEMSVLSDGRILLVGHVPPYTDPAGSSEFFIARLTETGNWDKTFGRMGLARFAFGPGVTGRVQKALIQPDGKVLFCGSVSNADIDVWMMRLRPNGRPDTSFGTDGIVINDFAPGGTDSASSIALSADGKIRLVGSIGTPANFLVARFSAIGAFEEHTSFPFTAGQYAQANDVTLQPDGKLLVIGETKNPSAATTGSAFAIARLTE